MHNSKGIPASIDLIILPIDTNWLYRHIFQPYSNTLVNGMAIFIHRIMGDPLNIIKFTHQLSIEFDLPRINMIISNMGVHPSFGSYR
ncbi:MAG: hypothetical protein WD098_11690 [Balneolales bacterium]